MTLVCGYFGLCVFASFPQIDLYFGLCTVYTVVKPEYYKYWKNLFLTLILAHRACKYLMIEIMCTRLVSDVYCHCCFFVTHLMVCKFGNG